jgi:sulfide:quinone oxidoreductase
MNSHSYYFKEIEMINIEKEVLPLYKELSRRDALKQMGALGLAPFLLSSTPELNAQKIDNKARIVIIGGGAAGITVAARLTRALENPNITLIEPNKVHIYQAGHTLVGGGIIPTSKITRTTKEFIPSGTKWIQSKANNIDPDQQKVSLENGKILDYDYLVIAPGLQYDWERIEGLNSSMIGKSGINSIYTLDGAVKTWENIQKFSKTGGEALFTHPDTPIKCGGAPKKILYLMDDYMRQQGTRSQAKISFLPNSGKLFSVPVFEKAIQGHFEQRDINYNLKHNLVKIDAANKRARFKTQIKRKGAWDEDLEEFEEIVEDKFIEKSYDFIHIPPPMSAPDFLKNSSVAWDKGSAKALGLVKVDKHTLQHYKYKNIFSLGDAAGTPIGKTGGTVRKQAPILVQNMLDVMAGKEPTQKFNGYTVCPIVTRYGKVMLAEFDYDLNPTPTIPGLSVEEERWMWWVMKVYILEPMYFYGMLKGIA